MKISEKICTYLLVVLMLASCHRNPGGSTQEQSRNSENQYYSNGSIKDSTVQVASNVYRELSFYESGGVKEIGYKEKGLRAGLYLNYSEDGKISKLQYFKNNEVVENNIDSADFYFENKSVDEYFSLNVPRNWQPATKPGIELAAKKTTADPFDANIVVVKADNKTLPPKDSIEQFINQLMHSQFKQLDIADMNWVKPNLLSVYYYTKHENDIVGHLDFFFVGEEDSYMIYMGAYNGEKSLFRNYVSLFLEISYSIRYKGKSVF